MRFVKVRNPWGRSGDWKGDWSDESPKWDEHPEVEQAMKDDESIGFDRLIRDGTFWMVWEDYVRQFDTIYMCRLFGEEFNQYLIQGAWKGNSAGGAHKAVLDERATSSKKGKKGNSKELQKEDVKNPTKPDQRRGTYIQKDGDSKWFNNPQYRITVDKETECYVTIMQRDRKLCPTTERESKDGSTNGGGRGSITPVHYFSDFTILRRPKSDQSRVWEHLPGSLLCHGTSSHYNIPEPSREIAKASIKLSPDYSYVLIPYTMKWGIELPYTIRIFTTGSMAVVAMPELYSRTFEGSWNTDPEAAITAGGPLRSKNSKRGNPRW